MFEKFGEFDSAEELNAAAKKFLEAEDEKSLLELAKENGIDKEDAEDYYDGVVAELASPIMAARGKLDVESKDLEIKGILTDWRDMILKMCMDDPKMCAAVRKKGKSLQGCMALFIGFAFDKKEPVSKKILGETMITHHGKKEKFKGDLYLGFPNRKEAKKLIEDYYLG